MRSVDPIIHHTKDEESRVEVPEHLQCSTRMTHIEEKLDHILDRLTKQPVASNTRMDASQQDGLFETRGHPMPSQYGDATIPQTTEPLMTQRFATSDAMSPRSEWGDITPSQVFDLPTSPVYQLGERLLSPITERTENPEGEALSPPGSVVIGSPVSGMRHWRNLAEPMPETRVTYNVRHSSLRNPARRCKYRYH